MREQDAKRYLEACYRVLLFVNNNGGEILASRLRSFTKELLLEDGRGYSENRRDNLINAMLVTVLLQRVKRGRRTTYYITTVGEKMLSAYRRARRENG